MQFQCSKCKQLIRADEQHYGKVIGCPKCGTNLKVPDAPSVTSQKQPADPLMGKQIAHYKIESLLGQGGMGKVYKAHNVRLNKTCALKILPPEFARQDKTRIERFVREAQSAANVDHPNVLPVQFVGNVGEHYFIEMNYVDGGTLDDELAKTGKLEPTHATRIIRDVAAALQAAHAKGIIHRDIKPSNVMLMKDGRVLVADFGLAKVAAGTTGLTVTGMLVGTPLYMSPEQAEGKAVDHRSDIYSLGVMFYQLLTGSPPFTADTPAALIHQHVYTPAPDIRQSSPDVSPQLAAIVMRMMAKKPEERYQECGEIVRELSGFSGVCAVGVKKAVPVGRKKRSLMPVVLIPMLIVIGIGVGLFISHQRSRRGAGESSQTETIVQKRYLYKGKEYTADEMKAMGIELKDDRVPEAKPSGPVPEKAERAAPSAGRESAEGIQEKLKAAIVEKAPVKEASPKVEAAEGKEPAAEEKVASLPAPAKEAGPPAKSAVPEEVKAIAVEEKPSEEAQAKAKLNQVVGELEELMASRQYDAALTTCGKAMEDPMLAKSEAELRTWQSNIEACNRVLERARSRAKGLVGKKYRVEIKTGARGSMRVTGDVVKFEDDRLTIRVGTKDMHYRLTQLGPREIVRLASEAGECGMRERLDQALLLFAEGCESEGLGMAREAEKEARGDEGLLEAAKGTLAFLNGWAGRREQEEVERRAGELLKDIMRDYDNKKWQEVIKGIEQFNKQFGETETSRKEAGKLASALEKAKEGQQLAADKAKMFTFWKFLGTMLSVPVNGKMEQVPAGRAWGVRYSPTGSCIAVASAFGADLWDPEKWQMLRRLDGHEKCVRAVDFSSDGSMVASGATDGSVILWEVKSGSRIWSLNPSGVPVSSVAVRPGQGDVAYACGGEIVIVGAKTGEEIRRINAHKYGTASLAYSPDGRLLASGATDTSAKIWDAETGAELFSLTGHKTGVACTVFSPDGTLLATGSYDSAVRIWDVEKGTLVKALPQVEASLRSLAFGTSRSLLYSLISSGSTGNVICLWDVDKGVEVKRSSPGRSPYAMSISPNRKLLAVTSSGDMRLVETEGFKVRHSVRYGTSQPVSVFSPAQPVVLAKIGSDIPGAGDGIAIVNVENGQLIRNWFGAGWEPAFSPDGNLLAMMAKPGKDAGVSVVDLQTGRTVLSLEKGNSIACYPAFSPDAVRLACRSSERSARIYDMKTKKMVAELTGHTGEISGLAYSPDGKAVATSAEDGTVRLWEAETGREVRVLATPDKKAVLCVSFHPGGQLLASGYPDGVVRIWNSGSGDCVQVLTEHGDAVTAVAFSADGSELAAGCYDTTVRLWDTKSWRQLQILRWHREGIPDVAFSCDGRVLASASPDGTVALWRRGQ